jgi:hypothetical protein
MRLTLRTLLAYLDDTLEPAQAKVIGQKVAESDTAQELIARIREVTRRRRITTPTGGGPGAKVDPNTVAEYLDNVLSAETLAEVEQLALASDVHLAEIAACHQILTLVLGEPATVPPLASKRMYELVKPPESDPTHRPPLRRDHEEPPVESKEVDETLRLGLPILRANTWNNRLILLGGVAAAFLLLAVAVWQLLLPSLGSGEDDSKVVEATGKGLSSPGVTKTDRDAKSKGDTKKGGKGSGSGDAQAEADKKNKAAYQAYMDDGHKAAKAQQHDVAIKAFEAAQKLQPGDQAALAALKDAQKARDEAVAAAGKQDKMLTFLGFPLRDTPVVDTKTDDGPPNPAVVDVGEYEPPATGSQSVLLQQLPDKKGKPQWVRLIRKTTLPKVKSNAPLLSLPGYRSTVVLDSKIKLTLWGNLPEICFMPLAHESLVVLHPSDKAALDVTLKRGRIAVSNPTDKPLKVRLRFNDPARKNTNEIWDITLFEKAEVFVNLSGSFWDGEPFYPEKIVARAGPTATLLMMVQSGKAILRADGNPFDGELLPPTDGGALVLWTSRKGFWSPPPGPKDLALGPWTEPAPDVPKGFDPKKFKAALKALNDLNGDLSTENINTVLLKILSGGGDVALHRLAVRCAGAIDDLGRVIEALKDKDRDVRGAAIETLWLWVAAERDNDYRLYAALQDYYPNEDEANLIMQLLHGFSRVRVGDGQKLQGDPPLYEMLLASMKGKQLAIRELAYWRLLQYEPAGIQYGYNATDNDKMLQSTISQWRELLQQHGKLAPAKGG